MATPKLFNRTRMTTATTGTGTITLGSAVAKYASFAEVSVSDGDTVTYCIEDGSDYEIGRGVYTASGTTMTRATVLESKVSGTFGTTKINLSGSAQVFIIAASQDLNALAMSRGADATAAATLNLEDVVDAVRNVTGSTGITAITLTDGHWRILRFTGTPVITNGASLVCPGGINYQVQAGDIVLAHARASNVVYLNVLQRTQEAIPVTSKSAAYTTVLSDANTMLLHPTADNNARTFTIDSNANVPYPIGTWLIFQNEINTLTIAITSDTLTMMGTGSTGSRTLAANGIATAFKKAATSWVINGSGLT